MAGISDRKQKRPSAGVRAGGGGGVMVGREGGSSSGPHGTLKEAFLKERVAALEQELVAAKASSGAANDQQVISSLSSQWMYNLFCVLHQSLNLRLLSNWLAAAFTMMKLLIC